MGTDRMHQVVLREPDNATAPVITAIREHVPKHWKKEIYYHSYLQEKEEEGSGGLHADQLPYFSWEDNGLFNPNI